MKYGTNERCKERMGLDRGNDFLHKRLERENRVV